MHWMVTLLRLPLYTRTRMGLIVGLSTYLPGTRQEMVRHLGPRDINSCPMISRVVYDSVLLLL